MRLVARVACSLALMGTCGGCGESGPAGAHDGVAGAAASAGSSGDSGSGNGSGASGGGSGASGAGVASGDDGGATGSGGDGVEVGAPCDPEARFENQRLLDELDTPDGTGARLTSNELTIVFEHDNEIYFAKRSSRQERFGAPTLLDLGVTGQKRAPWISDDEATLIFELDLDTVYISHRSGGAFGPAIGLFSPAEDPYVVGGANGRLYFIDGGYLMVAPLDNWELADAPDPVEVANLAGQRPVLSADELMFYFEDDNFIRVARRPTISDEFVLTSLRINIDAGANLPSWLSPDQCRLYADVGRGLYLLERTP